MRLLSGGSLSICILARGCLDHMVPLRESWSPFTSPAVAMEVSESVSLWRLTSPGTSHPCNQVPG